MNREQSERKANNPAGNEDRPSSPSGWSRLVQETLERLSARESANEQELARLERLLKGSLRTAFDEVVAGKLEAPAAWLEAFMTTQAFVERHSSTTLTPPERAAEALHWTWETMELAARAAQERGPTVRLADRKRSARERDVLRVLSEANGVYLSRGDIHARMKPSLRKTVQSVGHLLRKLTMEDLLLVGRGRKQGAADAAHYALARRGREVVAELKLKRPEPQPVLEGGADVVIRTESGIMVFETKVELNEARQSTKLEYPMWVDRSGERTARPPLWSIPSISRMAPGKELPH